MIGIAPNDIFPLNYPQGDPSLPACGAKAIPVNLDFSIDSEYHISLTNVQQQKGFGSLRCLWINNNSIYPLTVVVNGTNQTFNVSSGYAAYYPIINVNVPELDIILQAKTSKIIQILCLNFVPQAQMIVEQAQTQQVDVINFPLSQNVIIQSSVNLPVSGTVSVGNFSAANVASKVYTAAISAAQVSIGLSATTLVFGMSIYANNTVAVSDTLTLTLSGGNNTVVASVDVPAAITVAGIQGMVANLNNLRIALTNSGVSPKINLSGALTSGSYLINLMTN